MYARVIRTTIHLDKLDEATALFKSDVIGAAGEQPELTSIVLFANRATGSGLTLTLWQSEQAMRAAQESGWTRRQVERFAGMFAAEPVIETYEVSVRVRPTQPISHARVVTVRITPDKLDESIALYRDSIIPAAREQKGFLGGNLLTDRTTGNGISITGWASEAELKASESSGYLQAQMSKFGALFAAPPTTEIFEAVAAHIGA